MDKLIMEETFIEEIKKLIDTYNVMSDETLKNCLLEKFASQARTQICSLVEQKDKDIVILQETLKEVFAQRDVLATKLDKEERENTQRIEQAEKEKERYRKALENIMKHYTTVSKELALYSTVYHIAKIALEGIIDLSGMGISTEHQVLAIAKNALERKEECSECRGLGLITQFYTDGYRKAIDCPKCKGKAVR